MTAAANRVQCLLSVGQRRLPYRLSVVLGLQQMQIEREAVVSHVTAAIAFERQLVAVVAHVNSVQYLVFERHAAVLAHESPVARLHGALLRALRCSALFLSILVLKFQLVRQY